MLSIPMIYACQSVDCDRNYYLVLWHGVVYPWMPIILSCITLLRLFLSLFHCLASLRRLIGSLLYLSIKHGVHVASRDEPDWRNSPLKTHIFYRHYFLSLHMFSWGLLRSARPTCKLPLISEEIVETWIFLGWRGWCSVEFTGLGVGSCQNMHYSLLVRSDVFMEINCCYSHHYFDPGHLH